MTPLDVALHDARAGADHCTLDRCVCPTCAATEVLLRSIMGDRARRITVRASDFAGGAYPSVATVRVDGREVYRIHARPDEVFVAEVLDEIEKALRRPL